MRAATAGIALGLLFSAGCGGSGDVASEPLRDGVYEYELTQQYLLDNGISQFQAETESGRASHDPRRQELRRHVEDSRGPYWLVQGDRSSTDGTLVTFRWTSGCWGDWEMQYRVEGESVTWSDVERASALRHRRGPEVSEVFNGVPWTRIGTVPQGGLR